VEPRIEEDDHSLKVGKINKMIDRAFHPHYDSEYGPFIWLLDSLAHATVELLAGATPSSILRKEIRYQLSEAVKRAERRR